MNVDFPFHLDAQRHTAEDAYDEHVRDMLEELLFTIPGERVNRPDFGCGLRRFVFAPNSPEVAAALDLTARASIERWLGDILSVRDLGVTSEDSTLTVTVEYVLTATGDVRAASFSTPGSS